MLKDLVNGFYSDSFESRERSYFYVSDVGKCPRVLYFHFKDVPRTRPDARLMRIFDEGEHTHRRLLGVLYGLGIVQASEIRTPANDLIHGRADAIITLGNKPYIVEFKSSAGFKFRKMEEPREKHVGQIQLYMHYFNIPQGIILYENKDTQHLKEFVLKYDKYIAEDIIKMFGCLKEQIDKDIVPAKPENIRAWECRYCEYRRECQRIEESGAEVKKLRDKEGSVP